MRRASSAAALVLLGNAACHVHFPDPSKVEDLRVLDVEVEPPEIPVFAPGGDVTTLDAAHLPPLDLTTVRVTALSAHPDLDATFHYAWYRCRPGLSSLPCAGGDFVPLASGSTGTFSFTPIPLVFADLAAGASPASVVGSLAQDPLDLLNGLYAHVNLAVTGTSTRVKVDTPTLDATKRIVVFDPRIVAETIRRARAMAAAGGSTLSASLAALGLPSLCAGITDREQQKLFDFLAARAPNKSPRFDRVEAGVVRSSGAITGTRAVGIGEVLDAGAGEQISLQGFAVPGSAEEYGEIDAYCAIEDFTEQLSFSWFTNAGDLSRQLTTREQPITRYTAPELPPGTTPPLRARIWVVLRDSRGGAAHRTLDLLVH